MLHLSSSATSVPFCGLRVESALLKPLRSGAGLETMPAMERPVGNLRRRTGIAFRMTPRAAVLSVAMVLAWLGGSPACAMETAGALEERGADAKEVLAAWGKAMAAGSAEERQEAVRVLGRLLKCVGARDAGLADAFQRALRDEDPRVRSAAVAGLVPGRASDNEAVAILLGTALGDRDGAIRLAALKALTQTGSSARRAFWAFDGILRDDGPELVSVAFGMLAKEAKPGKETEGLTLAAVQVGPRPRPDRAATMWLVLANRSDHDIYVYQYFWRLDMRVSGLSFHDGMGFIATTPAKQYAVDFYCIPPGQSAGWLMDADSAGGAKNAAETQVRLRYSIPAKARDVVKGAVYSGQEMLSGPIDMLYDETPLDPELAQLAESFQKGTVGRERLNPTQPGKAGELARAALRLGMRAGTEEERWKFFDMVCRHPLPVFEGDMLDFLGRCGPRLKREDGMHLGIRGIKNALPKERQPEFVRRAAHAMIHDWRSASKLVTAYTNSENAAERAAATAVFSELYDRGDRRLDVMLWLATQLLGPDGPRLRDAAKARAVVEEAVRMAPGNQDCRFALACASGDKKALVAMAENAATPAARNSMAWQLAILFPADAGLADVAVGLAAKAVEATGKDRPERRAYVDTLAVCHAARGDYGRALQFEEEALSLLAAGRNERGGFAERVAKFAALAAAEADERPVLVLEPPKLHSRTVRDALLKRLKAEPDKIVAAELRRLLWTHYSTDPEVQEVVKAAAPAGPGDSRRTPQEGDPEEF